MTGAAGLPQIPETAVRFFIYLRAALIILTPLFAIGIVVLVYKINRLRREEKHEMRMMLLNAAPEKAKNERWEKVLKYLDSESESDWKLAIIEADTILDDLVESLNYPGENLGERLKNVEPSDFDTLQDAWEAHKVRNRIAHEADYRIGRRDARAVIERFRRVFEEFNYI